MEIRKRHKRAAGLFATTVMAGALGLTARPALAVSRANACTALAEYAAAIAGDRDKGVSLDDERHVLHGMIAKDTQRQGLNSDQRAIVTQTFDTLVIDVYKNPASSAHELQTAIYNQCINASGQKQ
ncbi:MAG: hypothetical protein JO307_14495 [Bryobacterales bacterium]|nr:hypothetical protein [Bryobacterales bacterium]